MTIEKAVEIYNGIDDYFDKPLTKPFKFEQFRSCNAYLSKDTINIKGHSIRLVKSYQTIVGYVDYNESIFVEIGKFSRTTSKQCTQIYNAYYRDFDRLNCHQ